MSFQTAWHTDSREDWKSPGLWLAGRSFCSSDEPAAGMNETETRDLFQLIKKIQEQGITVLLIEHDMSLVMKFMMPTAL